MYLLCVVGTAAGGNEAAILAADPEPVADDHLSEFILVRLPEDAPEGPYVLSDAETKVSLPNRTGPGRHCVRLL